MNLFIAINDVLNSFNHCNHDFSFIASSFSSVRRISNYKKLGCASTVEILLPRFWESINLKHRCELMGVDMFLFDAKESSLCKPKGEKKGPGAYYGSNSAQEIVSQDPWDFTDISHVTGRQILIRKMSKSQWICFKMVELEKSNAAGLNDQKANLEGSSGRIWSYCEAGDEGWVQRVVTVGRFLLLAPDLKFGADGCYCDGVYGSWSVKVRGRDPYLQRVGGGWFPFGLDLWFSCRVGLAVVCGDEQLCRLLCGSEARCATVMWWRVGRSRRV
ncbi:hypothetical protein Bca4012_090755 [Brassica carinata]